MKSFIISFVLFIAWLAILLGVGYHADAFLKKTLDYQVREGDAITITDHREEYPGVMYTRYVDGVEVSWVETPWLLMSRDHLSDVVVENGNNQVIRKIERTLQDDFQKSTELLANLIVNNSPPVIADFEVLSTDINTIELSYAVLDPASSDYPLHAQISLQNSKNTVVFEKTFDIISDQKTIYSINTEFAWCNQEFLATFEVEDDNDSISISKNIFIACAAFDDEITWNIQYLQVQNPRMLKYSSKYWSMKWYHEDHNNSNVFMISYYITDRRNIAII
jgi:hypothetical protein